MGVGFGVRRPWGCRLLFGVEMGLLGGFEDDGGFGCLVGCFFLK